MNISNEEQKPEKYVETVIRPTRHANKEVSFLWTPGQCLTELIYTPEKGLRFAVKDKEGFRYCDTFRDFRPLRWIADYARVNAIKLPSRLEDYKNLDHLAGSIRAVIHKYFDADEAFEAVAVLYVLHTWVYERFHAVPYLRFLGISGTGKTRGTETIGSMCYRPLVIAGSATPAAMFRMMDAVGGTLLIDEADFQDSQIGTDVIKILNCGYQKGLPVTRMEQVNNAYEPRLYEAFGPKIINGREKYQDDATESRCLAHTPVLTDRVDIPLQLPESFTEETRQIRNIALAWRFDVLDSFKLGNVSLPHVRPRTNQILQPLLLIAENMTRKLADEYKDALLRYATMLEFHALEERKETPQGVVLQAFFDLPSKPRPTCKEIADQAIMRGKANDPKLPDWLTPRRTGAILRELGFEVKHMKRGYEATLPQKRQASLIKRFGIVIPSSPESSPTGDGSDAEVNMR